MSEPDPQLERLHCNECGHKTTHKRLHHHSREHHPRWDDSADDPEAFEVRHELLECCGCGEVVLRDSHFGYSDSPVVDYFPPRVFRKVPDWIHDVKADEEDLLREVYRAIDANCSRLAVFGCRTLIDVRLTKMVGDIGGFKKKLEKLEEREGISKADRATLETVLEVGNATAHRGHTPRSDDVEFVLNFIEHLLRGDIHNWQEGDVRERTPARKQD